MSYVALYIRGSGESVDAYGPFETEREAHERLRTHLVDEFGDDEGIPEDPFEAVKWIGLNSTGDEHYQVEPLQ